VSFEDAGDGGDDGGWGGADALPFGQEVGVHQDERCAEPDRSPECGEDSGARGVLDGEAGDNFAPELARETAHVVDAVGGGEDGRKPPGVVNRKLGEVGVDVP
jgi:hypothetical protein